MCGLKKIFEGAGNFFDKKVSANPTFLLRENSNQTVFIKTLMKSFAPHLFRYAQHLLHEGEGKPLSHCVTAPLSWEPSQIESRP